MNTQSRAVAYPRGRRALRLPVLVATALVAGLVTIAQPSPQALAQAASGTGVYVPVTPSRIYDSRQAGSGGVFAPRTSRDIQVGGVAGVPTSDVIAVVLDITATNTQGDGWGLVWQAGTPMPSPVSSINYINGRAVTNVVTSKVSANGKVSYFSWTWADLIVDVIGYYRPSSAGGGYASITQARIFDSRNLGFKIPSAYTFDLKLRGIAGIPDSSAVNAVVLNASAFNQDGPGYVNVYPKGIPRPGTSSMNYATQRMQTQMIVTTLSADGQASVYNQGGNIDIIFDVVGYYTTSSTSGIGFNPLTPTRVIDTRYNVPGWGTGPITQPLAPNTNTAIKLTGVAGVPESGVSVVMINVVAGGTSSAGWLGFWSSDETNPGTLTHTYYPVEHSTNLVMAKVGADGKVMVTNYTGSPDLVIDVLGYFGTPPPGPTTTTSSSTTSSTTSTSSTSSSTTTTTKPTTTTTAPPPPEGPSAPGNVAIIAMRSREGRGEATISWSRPTQLNGSEIRGYVVTVEPSCSTCRNLDVPDPGAISTVVAGLTLGTPYTFRVRATSSAGSGTLSDPVRGTPMPRIMTWNLKRNLVLGGDTANLDRIATVIRSNEADIVGLQEVTKDQVDTLSDMLAWPAGHWIETKNPGTTKDPEFDYCPEGFPTPSSFPECIPFGNGILSRLPSENRPPRILTPSPVESGREDRILIHARVTFDNGAYLDIYNTHLMAKGTEESDAERDVQAGEVVAAIQQDRDTSGLGFRAILTCDCNADPVCFCDEDPVADPAIRTLRVPLLDAWAAARPGENPLTSGLTGEYDDQGNPTRRLDYVFFGRQDGMTVNDSDVGPTSLSDHRPVIIQPMILQS